MKKFFYLPALIILSATMLACTPIKNQKEIKSKNNKESSLMSDSTKTNDTTYTATISTNMGDIKLELFPEAAPKAVENFVVHAEKGYYNGVIFHRVIDGFMIQGGDPTGTGRGGESIWGGKFDDEISPNLKFDSAGILAMANAGPNTNGSQFFITVAATPWLDGHYTIFGKVIGGMDVVYEISKVKRNAADRPLTDIEMNTVTIEKTAK